MKLGPFSGIIPRIPETALPSGAAIAADNIDFAYGELRSLKGDFKLRDMANSPLSLFSEDGLRFYSWSEDVDAVISPLQNGPANDRLYYTTDSDFRVTPRSLVTLGGSAPTTSYRVGVPRPTVAPSIIVKHPVAPVMPPAVVEATPADTYVARLQAAQAVLDAKNLAAVKIETETRAYTYTYANSYNEEGPPSDPVVVEVKAQTVDGVTTYSAVTVQVTFDGSGQYVPITQARIYRTSDGGNSADYYYAPTASAGASKVNVPDTVHSDSLNELLSSVDNYPPDPALRGLISMGNGILAAWQGNVMRFSDAYRPWSWNPTNFVTFDATVVGAITHGAGALVTTVASPSMVSGVSPDAMTQVSLGIPQAGVSKWSMLSVNGMALYASHDGLVAIVGGQPDLRISERYFTREVWRHRYATGLSSMQFAYYDGRIVVFSKAAKFTAFMLSMDEASGAMTELPGLIARGALVLTTSDQMYTVNGRALNQFGGGGDLALRWKSGDMVLPATAILSMAEVECTGSFTIKFYQDGRLGYTKAITTGKNKFRLPRQAIPGHLGLRPSDRWQIEITGTGTLKWLKAAETARGLRET
ncbi:MAG: hypothetical protein WKF61_01050 [Luteimonas sp.]